MAKVVKFKFSLGDTVYFMSGNKVTTGVTEELLYDECKQGVSINYVISTESPSRKSINQEECFSSKAKLLKSL